MYSGTVRVILTNEAELREFEQLPPILRLSVFLHGGYIIVFSSDIIL